MNKPERYILSDHARRELARRGIAAWQVAGIMDQPGQIVSARGDRTVYQSLVVWPGGKMYVIRVVVDRSSDPPVVLTAYRSSKIAKYWGKEP